MGNFLGNLGAAFRGQQEYQTFLAQQAQAQMRLKMEQEQLAQIKDLAAQTKQQRDRDVDVNQGMFDYLSQTDQAIPPPPPPPDQQAPAPGQASVPMEQPSVRYGQRPMPGGLPPPPQGQPMQPQGPQMAPQGPQGAPAGPPPVQPYRTVGGPPAGAPQAGPQGIPPPPPQQPGQPAPNSMSLQDAAQFIKSRGITDPTTSVQILEKLSPYLNNQAKQEAAMLKMQLADQEKKAALMERGREADQRSKDYNLSVEERRQASKESADIRKLIGLTMAGISQQNADTRKKAAGDGVGGSAMEDGAVDAAAWNYLLRGTNPPARGGMYQATMKRVSQIAKENNMTVQELTSASADVKTKLAAKKNFEVRAQNMERAENQILSEIPVMEDAMKSLDLSRFPAFAKGGMAALRQLGDPRVTTLDQAAETVFNEFEGIRTGNPGTLNVSDVAKAQKDYEEAKTPQQMAAAISGMKRIMGNAKQALAKTRKDIMVGINDSLTNKVGENDGPTKIKDAADYAKLKSGDEYITPDGQHKRKP